MWKTSLMVLIFKTWKLGELQRVWEGLVGSVSYPRRERLCIKAYGPTFLTFLGGLSAWKEKHRQWFMSPASFMHPIEISGMSQWSWTDFSGQVRKHSPQTAWTGCRVAGLSHVLPDSASLWACKIKVWGLQRHPPLHLRSPTKHREERVQGMLLLLR